MFVVLGITGQTGAAAAEALLAAGQPVRALVRDAAKAHKWAARGVEIVTGDAGNAADLARAFAGAKAAYVLAPPMPAHPDPVAGYVAIAEATRDAVQRSGLPHLVFLSSEGAHLPSGTGPILGLHRAEEILRGAAPRVTFLRASYFQENWRNVHALALAEGILPTMLMPTDRKRDMVATLDIGREAARLLQDPKAPSIVELGGPELFSADDAAAAMARVLGKPVQVVTPPREAWVGILTGAGLGPAYAGLLAEMYDGINSGHVRFSGDGEARRGTATLDETFASWRA